MTVAVLLVALAVLDGAFAGFRAEAGRLPLIRKRGAQLRALVSGAGAGSVACGALGGLTFLALSWSSDAGGDFAELVRMGALLLVPFGAYAALVLLALVVYAAARHEVRTFATVAILGPFTLARPWLVVGATAWATAGSARAIPIALTWIASMTVLGTSVVLDRLAGREVRWRALMA